MKAFILSLLVTSVLAGVPKGQDARKYEKRGVLHGGSHHGANFAGSLSGGHGHGVISEYASHHSGPSFQFAAPHHAVSHHGPAPVSFAVSQSIPSAHHVGVPHFSSGHHAEFSGPVAFAAPAPHLSYSPSVGHISFASGPVSSGHHASFAAAPVSAHHVEFAAPVAQSVSFAAPVSHGGGYSSGSFGGHSSGLSGSSFGGHSSGLSASSFGGHGSGSSSGVFGGHHAGVSAGSFGALAHHSSGFSSSVGHHAVSFSAPVPAPEFASHHQIEHLAPPSPVVHHVSSHGHHSAPSVGIEVPAAVGHSVSIANSVSLGHHEVPVEEHNDGYSYPVPSKRL